MSEESATYSPALLEQPLTLRQQLFVDALIGEARGNATRAAYLAGYTGAADTVKVTASNLLTNPNVSAAVEAKRKTLLKDPQVVLLELLRIALGTLEPFIDANGLVDLSTDQARANMDLIQELSTDQEGRIHIKGYSRLDAIKTLGKIYGLYVERTQSTNITLHLTPEDLHAAQERIAAFNASMGIPPADTPDNV